MTREIKFRAWDNIDKKMYSYALIGFNGELNVHKDKVHTGVWINIGCGRDDGEVDYDNVIMQYTGLKNRNGDEIYEGDIIESTWNGKRFVVEWDLQNGEWKFCEDCNEEKGKYYGTKVIGNIYENPKLLKHA